MIECLATVITNLLSAIPYFGQDIVESTNLTELFTKYTNLSLIYNSSIMPGVLLPTVGTVNKHALKKGLKIIIKHKYGPRPDLLL